MSSRQNSLSVFQHTASAAVFAYEKKREESNMNIY